MQLTPIASKPRKPSGAFIKYLREHNFRPGEFLTARDLSFAYYRHATKLPLTDEACAYRHRDSNCRGNAGFEIRRLLDYGYISKFKKGHYIVVHW
jgi:hypothetical protein